MREAQPHARFSGLVNKYRRKKHFTTEIKVLGGNSAGRLRSHLEVARSAMDTTRASYTGYRTGTHRP